MSSKIPSKERSLIQGIPDEHYNLIGMVVVEWSRLETILGTLIWHFLKLDMEDGRIITATLDARPKVRMLRDLAKRHAKPKATLTQILDLLDAVEGLQERRNIVAHGIWGTAMPENTPAVSSIRPKSHPFHVVTERYSRVKLMNLATLIRDIADVLHGVPDELSSSQKKYDEQLNRLKTSQKPAQKDRSLAKRGHPPKSSPK